jgi:RNase adaptor protein for sRNA GlmZ degradation
MARIITSNNAEVSIFSLSKGIMSPSPQWEYSLHSFRDPMREFRSKDGTDPEVQAFLREDPKTSAIIKEVNLLCYDILRAQGQKYTSIGFRDHHGKWISCGVAEIIAEELAPYYEVMVLHAYNRR